MQVKGKAFPVEVFSVARLVEAGAAAEPVIAGQGPKGDTQYAGHAYSTDAAPPPVVPARHLKPIIGAERMCAQVEVPQPPLSPQGFVHKGILSSQWCGIC